MTELLMVTATKEDYLRAIDHLYEEHDRNVKSKEVAEYLQLAKSTVSERLNELSKQNLITYGHYSHIKLTTKGRKMARNITYKHRIIESFLHDILGLNKKKIHEEAHKLEHAFSDESIRKLSRLIGNPKTDPHGKPIPR